MGGNFRVVSERGVEITEFSKFWSGKIPRDNGLKSLMSNQIKLQMTVRGTRKKHIQVDPS